AREAGAEHAHGMDLRLGSERPNDSGAGSPVAAEIALLVQRRDGLATLAHRDGDSALHLTDERMVSLDAAVEDADAHACARRAAHRPRAVDPLRQRIRDPDAP